jgi:hypothetical protein
MLLTPVASLAQGTINVRAERLPIDKLFADIEKQTGKGFRVSREIEPLRLTVLLKDMPAQKFRDLTKQVLHLSWEERAAADAPSGKAWFLYRSPRNAEEERQMRELPVRRLRERIQQFVDAGRLSPAQLDALEQTDPNLADTFKSDPRTSTAWRFLGTLPGSALDRIAKGKALGFPLEGAASSPHMQAANALLGGARVEGGDGPPKSFTVKGEPKQKGMSFGLAGGNFSIAMTMGMLYPNASDAELSPFSSIRTGKQEADKWLAAASSTKGTSSEDALLNFAETSGRNIIAEWYPTDSSNAPQGSPQVAQTATGSALSYTNYASPPWEVAIVDNTLLIQAREWYDLRLELISEDMQVALDKLFERSPPLHEAWTKASELTYEQASNFRTRNTKVLYIYERTMYGVLQLEAHLDKADRERILSERGSAVSSLSQKGRAAVNTLLQAADDDGKLIHPLPPRPNIWLVADPKSPTGIQVVLRERSGDIAIQKVYLHTPLKSAP